MAMDKIWRELFARLDRIEAALGIAPAEDAPPVQTVPWPGYDEMSVEDITKRFPSLKPAERKRVLEYERAHKGRTGIITPLVNWNS